ncbi:MAG TPA: alcohol dehydrogenase catalytic domain-containing protein [Acidimicrobiales bacterium]|nr:alcohol dehydrogenase catalytic domain-containing protein [Acidimicrobiales bacterium]
MRALVLRADAGEAKLQVEDVGEPSPADGDVLVQSLALGVCGTDRKLAQRLPRTAAGRESLILGHESLGRVLEAPAGSGLRAGDLVAGIVRRPDPQPCAYCAAGEFDMCDNGGYVERGISGRDGYGAERYRVESDYAVRVDPALGLAGVLLEPASIVAKAWERVERLAPRQPGRVLIVGAGPIGLLAALLAVQRGHEIHVLDRVASGVKVRRAEELGAVYHAGPGTVPGGFDVVLECSGALEAEAVGWASPSGVVCLLLPRLPAGGVPLGNRAVIGTVNSNRRHFEQAAAALLAADRPWLDGLLGPLVPLEDWRLAFDVGPDAIKAVIDLGVDDTL